MSAPHARARMPSDIGKALDTKRLRKAYASRPAYQRNDYLYWIGSAVRDDTRERRIAQMLAELKRGDVYMKMPWAARH